MKASGFLPPSDEVVREAARRNYSQGKTVEQEVRGTMAIIVWALAALVAWGIIGLVWWIVVAL
jgi:hypothetical protein